MEIKKKRAEKAKVDNQRVIGCDFPNLSQEHVNRSET